MMFSLHQAWSRPQRSSLMVRHEQEVQDCNVEMKGTCRGLCGSGHRYDVMCVRLPKDGGEAGLQVFQLFFCHYIGLTLSDTGQVSAVFILARSFIHTPS